MTLQCIEIALAAELLGGKRTGREMLFQCPCHEDQHPAFPSTRKRTAGSVVPAANLAMPGNWQPLFPATIPMIGKLFRPGCEIATF
jgi:hypothetical protein